MKKLIYYTAVLSVGFILTTGCQEGSQSRNAYREAGIRELDAGNYESAVNSLEQALDKSRGLVGKFEFDVLKYRAEAEYKSGDPSSAVHTYDILIQADKERPEYVYLRSMAMAGAGDITGALEDYSRISESDKEAPGRENALLAIGSAMEDEGNASEAFALYQQALTDGIRNAQLYNRMGLCKMKEQAYDEALSYFTQGIQMGDDAVMPQLKYNEAVAYEYSGDFAKALELMEQYIAAYGTDEAAEREIIFLKTR